MLHEWYLLLNDWLSNSFTGDLHEHGLLDVGHVCGVIGQHVLPDDGRDGVLCRRDCAATRYYASLLGQVFEFDINWRQRK